MGVSINDKEKEILPKFINAYYPNVYKLDNTDNTLFVEEASYLCPLVLKGRKVTDEMYNEIIKGYEKFECQLDKNKIRYNTL